MDTESSQVIKIQLSLFCSELPGEQYYHKEVQFGNIPNLGVGLHSKDLEAQHMRALRN